MSDTDFPTALDDFTNPTGGGAGTGSNCNGSGPGGAPTLHSLQHAQLNDAVEAIEAIIGITASADSASIVYKIAAIQAAVLALAGTSLLYGSGAPDDSTTGVDGNFYLDSSIWKIYGPKASGAWPAGISLIGPKGDDGAAGAGATVTTDAPTNTSGTLWSFPVVSNAAFAPNQPVFCADGSGNQISGTIDDLSGSTYIQVDVSASLGAIGSIATGSVFTFGAKGADGSPGGAGATGPGYYATSATSLATVATGSVAFTTQAGLAYSAGARIRATSVGAGDWMEGVVSAYSGTTLTVTMDAKSGSGTHTDWNINLAGQPGAGGSGIPAAISVRIGDPAGVALTVGEYVTIQAPSNITLTGGWDILLDGTDTVTVDVRKAAWPALPTSGDSICGGNYPGTTAATHNTSANYTGWTSTSIAQRTDNVTFIITATTTAKYIDLTLFGTRT